LAEAFRGAVFIAQAVAAAQVQQDANGAAADGPAVGISQMLVTRRLPAAAGMSNHLRRKAAKSH